MRGRRITIRCRGITPQDPAPKKMLQAGEGNRRATTDCTSVRPAAAGEAVWPGRLVVGQSRPIGPWKQPGCCRRENRPEPRAAVGLRVVCEEATRSTPGVVSPAPPAWENHLRNVPGAAEIWRARTGRRRAPLASPCGEIVQPGAASSGKGRRFGAPAQAWYL